MRYKGMRAVFILAAVLLTPVLARADDFGPARDTGAVRTDARALLAHRARLAKVDPKHIVISDVVVSGDQAILSWEIGRQLGFMGLVRNENRWWDALDAGDESTAADCWYIERAYPLSTTSSLPDRAPSQTALVASGFSAALAAAADRHNTLVREVDARTRSRNAKVVAGQPVKPVCEDDIYVIKPDLNVHRSGGTYEPVRSETSGYALTFHYAPSDAQAGSTFQEIRVRPPTHAEFLPYPTPFRYVSDAVMFFDFGVEGTQPVSFQRGSTLDVWFPFALDDALKYSMTFSAGSTSVGPVTGSIFDNVLHFDLPAFTAAPGETFMGEIDGDVH